MPDDKLHSPGHEPAHHSPSQSDATEPRWNVFLRSPATGGGYAAPRLARLLGLDVYGESLLSRRAATEMGFVAIVLVVIFLFDFGAWSLLFNAVIHSAVDDIDLLTPVAVLGGALFAFAVLTYERQFVVSDTSSGWLRLLPPMSLRFAVIITAAIITAQPIELLFFRGPILHHTHKELVREHAAGLLVDLETLEERTAAAREIPTSVSKGPEAQRLQTHDQRIQEQSEAVRDLENSLVKAERERRNWSWTEEVRRNELRSAGERLAGLRATPGDVGEALAAAERAHAAARQRHAAADRNKRDYTVTARNLKDDLETARERLVALERDRSPIYAVYRKLLDDSVTQTDFKVDALQREGQKVRRWLQKLVALEPDAEPVSEEIGGVTYTFEPRAYDFFEQLRVLADLRNARPPRWPGSSTEEIRALAANFGVRDLRNCDQPRDAPAMGTAEGTPPCTEEEKASWEGFRARARLFHWSWIVVYGIAVIIPCLVIAIKLLLPAELKAYYSGRYQAAAGNPDAMSLLTVDRIVKSES